MEVKHLAEMQREMARRVIATDRFGDIRRIGRAAGLARAAPKAPLNRPENRSQG